MWDRAAGEHHREIGVENHADSTGRVHPDSRRLHAGDVARKVPLQLERLGLIGREADPQHAPRLIEQEQLAVGERSSVTGSTPDAIAGRIQVNSPFGESMIRLNLPSKYFAPSASTKQWPWRRGLVCGEVVGSSAGLSGGGGCDGLDQRVFFSSSAAQPSSRSAQTPPRFDRRPALFRPAEVVVALRRIVQTGRRGVGSAIVGSTSSVGDSTPGWRKSHRPAPVAADRLEEFLLARAQDDEHRVADESPWALQGIDAVPVVAKRAKLRCADLEVRHQQIAEQFRGVIGLNGDPRGRDGGGIDLPGHGESSTPASA